MEETENYIDINDIKKCPCFSFDPTLLQVYYKTCPEITQSFATYPETPPGKTEGSIDKVPEPRSGKQ